MVRLVEEALPFRGALAGREAEVDDLLPAVVAGPRRHQDRPPERAVGHHRLAVILQRPAVECRDRPVEGPGDPAHRRGRDRAPGQGEEDLADLAGREPRNDAGRDRTVDLRGASRGALRNPGRAEVTGTRHVAFDVTERARQVPLRRSRMAPASRVSRQTSTASAIRHSMIPAIDDPRRRLATEGATALAPLRSICLYLLHHLERLWQTPGRCSLPWHRGASVRGCCFTTGRTPFPTDT